MMTLEGAGRLLSSYSEEEQEELKEQDPDLFAEWDEQIGDRITELVFIGCNIAKGEIISSLDHCLVSEEEGKAISSFVDSF